MKNIFCLLITMCVFFTGCTAIQQTSTPSMSSIPSNSSIDDDPSSSSPLADSDVMSENVSSKPILTEDASCTPSSDESPTPEPSEKPDDEEVPFDLDYTALLVDYSDSVDGVSCTVEYEFAERDRYEQITPSEKIQITIQQNKIEGTYRRSRYSAYNYYPEYVYTDKHNNLFYVDPDGNLVSCFWGQTVSDKDPLTREQCVDIGKAFAAEIFDISSYQLRVTDDPQGKFYRMKFTKPINGYKTSEFAEICVQYTGELYSFSSSMLGKINIDSNASIDEEKLKSAVYERVDALYAPIKDNYDRVEYGEVTYMITVLKDGSCGVICEINVDFINIRGEYSLVTGAYLSFVVT